MNVYLLKIQDENEVLKNSLSSTRCEIADTEERIIAKHKELQEVDTFFLTLVLPKY